jgi:hypothetical protein
MTGQTQANISYFIKAMGLLPVCIGLIFSAGVVYNSNSRDHQELKTDLVEEEVRSATADIVLHDDVEAIQKSVTAIEKSVLVIQEQTKIR